MKCTNCYYQNDEDAEFCENCGHRLARTCLNCGAPLNPDAKFCKKCGAPVIPHPTPLPSKESEEGIPGRMSALASLRQSAPEDFQAKILAATRNSEGKRKPVTIVFTDIVSSTALAEKLDPEDWKEVVNGVHRLVTEIVYRYEGIIAQLLGDGVLAFFGAPVTHEDDPIRAVRAALDIQKEMARYAGDLRGFIENLQLRIGINTGIVVVGTVGSDLHMEYLAIGDSVNLAARLQSAADPGSILISETTARFITSLFELQDLGEIQVKGKSEPVQVFEVGGVRSTSASGKRIEDLASTLVGRQAELEMVQTALAELKEGRGGIIFVLGEAGIGKSRLVEEARVQFWEDNLNWLEGRSLSYGQALPYWPISQLIRNDLGISEADPDGKVSIALRRRTKQLFNERAIDVIPYLTRLLGLDLEPNFAETIRSLDNETLKNQTRVTISEYFAAIAQTQPTILVLDDLHWADQSSLDTLERLFPLTNQVPILFIFLSRIERDHYSWRLKQRAETDFAYRTVEIQLQPLHEQDANSLIENLLEAVDLTSEVRKLILRRAEGNPLFIEELIRSLIDRRVLIRESPSWRQAREITYLDVPDTLQGLLLARIDQLEESLRTTLQMAAVIGESFLYRLLSAITQADSDLDNQLAELQRLDMVREKSRIPELEYMFKHSLTQKAAYDSLLIEKRRGFHQKVGEAIENLFHDLVDDFPGLLAHHFDLAGDVERAIHYLLRAGDKAQREDALDEAIRNYRRAIEIFEDSGNNEELAGQTWLKLGLVYSTDFRFDEAYKAYEKVFAFQNKRLPQFQSESAPKRSLSSLKAAASGSGWLDHPDPGKAVMVTNLNIILNIFEGLARIDDDLNLIPVLARSWQVLDGGSRYLIYIRGDAQWTDGQSITASDFEWAWKRNLRASKEEYPANMLDDITGARDFRLGKMDDPEKVGVKALNETTLEVKLDRPSSHFPYLLWHPVTFPLPRKVIESWGDDWWKPEHIVSNGPYQLVRFEPGQGLELAHNPHYHGEFSGNVNRVNFTLEPDLDECISSFRSRQLDMTWLWREQMDDELFHYAPDRLNELSNVLAVFPVNPPITDIRVRKAFAYALGGILRRGRGSLGGDLGGILPRGLPGHSPGLKYPYDPEQAKRLLAEAGYPGGKGFPMLQAGIGDELRFDIYKQPIERMAATLGIDVSFRPISYPYDHIENFHLYIVGWILDYPDPDGIMRLGNFQEILHKKGWSSEEYDALVNQADTTQNRSIRMELYRRADRLLVRDQVVIAPIEYGDVRPMIQITQPWIKGVKNYPVGGWIQYKYLTIDEDERQKDRRG